MDGSLPMLLFLVFGAAAAAIGYYQHQRKLERQRTLRTLALEQGLDFSVDDPFDTLREPFSLLHRGDGRGVENVLWGFWQELEVRVFDYWFYEETSDANGRRSRSTSRFDCVLALVDAYCPQLTIREENVLTRVADALTLRDIEFESAEFNRRFTVKGADERFASAFCDARMIAWLLEHGAGYAFEVIGDRMLCWRRRGPAADKLDGLGTARAFNERIPAVVSSLYPRG
jgi:hypothetical protein